MSNNKRSGITLKTKYEILLDIDKGDIEINCFKSFFNFSPLFPVVNSPCYQVICRESSA